MKTKHTKKHHLLRFFHFFGLVCGSILAWIEWRDRSSKKSDHKNK